MYRQMTNSIAVLAIATYLSTGLDFLKSNQIGQWAAGVMPITTNMFFDFAIFSFFIFIIQIILPIKQKENILYKILLITLIVAQIFCIKAAWNVTILRMAQGIDHPAFLFRIREFFTVFPALGSYNPWWNAGTEHFIGVTSGSHSFAFLMAPFLILFPIEYAHSFAILFWMIVGFPWLTVITFKRAGMRHIASIMGGIAMFAFTRSEFLFFWQSGNLGGMVTAMLAPSITALGYRIVVQRKGNILDIILIIICAWLSCIWTPGVFTCIGLLIGAIWNYRRFNKKTFRQCILIATITLLLLSPWLWTTFFPARGIVDYVTTGTNNSLYLMIKIGIRHTWTRLQEWHPFILGLGTLCFISSLSKGIRRWILPTFLLLLAITTSIGFIKNSQLDRVIIQLAGLMIFPAAITGGRLVAFVDKTNKLSTKLPSMILLSIMLSTLIIGTRIAKAHYANSAGFKLWPANPCVYEFSNWINKTVPQNGRIAFAGVTDCKFEWAKPTYLPILANREMMSDDYYGYPVGLTERNYPPKRYRKTLEAYLKFTDAHNITHWVVTDSRNKAFFDANTNAFTLIDYRMLQSTHIYTYKRIRTKPLSDCYLGEAKVHAQENKITIKFNENQRPEDVVIRYNWRSGLYSKTKGAAIEPYKIDDGIIFIKVIPNNANEVIIGYRPTWAPLEPNLDGTFHH